MGITAATAATSTTRGRTARSAYLAVCPASRTSSCSRPEHQPRPRLDHLHARGADRLDRPGGAHAGGRPRRGIEVRGDVATASTARDGGAARPGPSGRRCGSWYVDEGPRDRELAGVDADLPPPAAPAAARGVPRRRARRPIRRRGVRAMRIPLVPGPGRWCSSSSRPIGPPAAGPRCSGCGSSALSTGGCCRRGRRSTRVAARRRGRPSGSSPAGADESRAVLLLHGGAFLIGSPRTHRVLAAHLVGRGRRPGGTSCTTGGRPSTSFPAAVDDALRRLRRSSPPRGRPRSSVTRPVGAWPGSWRSGCGTPARPAPGAGPGLAGHRPDAWPAARAAYGATTSSSGGPGLRPASRAFVGDADAAGPVPWVERAAGRAPRRSGSRSLADERLRAEGEELADRLRGGGRRRGSRGAAPGCGTTSTCFAHLRTRGSPTRSRGSGDGGPAPDRRDPPR